MSKEEETCPSLLDPPNIFMHVMCHNRLDWGFAPLEELVEAISIPLVPKIYFVLTVSRNIDLKLVMYLLHPFHLFIIAQTSVQSLDVFIN
jgi:hypothetical protein